MLIKLLPAVPELYLRLALTYEAISQAGRPANMVVRFSHIPGFRASHHGFAIFLEEPLPRLIDRLDSNNRIKKSKCFIWCRLGARGPFFLSLSCAEFVPNSQSTQCCVVSHPGKIAVQKKL